MDRRKELVAKYKQTKPQMGILIVRSKLSNKCFILKAFNLKGKINSTKFQLGFGSHPNRELQKDWNENGEENFIIEILDNLDYDKDESKTDYRDELTLLETEWAEKLTSENMIFYK